MILSGLEVGVKSVGQYLAISLIERKKILWKNKFVLTCNFSKTRDHGFLDLQDILLFGLILCVTKAPVKIKKNSNFCYCFNKIF